MRSGVPRRNGTEARPESSERTDDMKSKFIRMLRATAWLALCLALSAATRAQQPTPQPSPSQQKSADDKTKGSAPKAGDAAGDYTVTSSIELGYRGLKVDGDINKYQSDLNYKAGVRLFDTSFLLKAKEGKKGGLFDTLLVTSTGWGADPYGHARFSAENSKWYRFDGQYRRFRYFNFLNNIANPNFSTQPTNPVTGDQLIFNGEIYNFGVLRKELESAGIEFQGHSDTEVLLHALTRWGADCVPRLKQIFADEKLPPQLVWVAEVESSFNPAARSPAGAAGLFQLMPATARALNLALRPRDERLQMEKSARAAARHLRHLGEHFGDWRLALAAYNAGENRVDQLLKQSKMRTFDAIAARLPVETQMYVPKVEATLRKREGLTLADLPH